LHCCLDYPAFKPNRNYVAPLSLACNLSVQWNERDELLFNLLRIKGLYMFRALLAHPQEDCGTWYIAYILCQLAAPGSKWNSNPGAANWHNTHAITKCCLCSSSWGWASNALNIQRRLILNKLNKKRITLVLLYWYTVMHGHYTDILWCTVTILIYCDVRSLYW
jgi:hypothetical protein